MKYKTYGDIDMHYGAIANKTKFLTDERVLEETSGALGYNVDDLTLISKKTSGTNTYISLKANDGKEFNCIINSGNLLTFGMINPPMCAPKGEKIKTPFS